MSDRSVCKRTQILSCETFLIYKCFRVASYPNRFTLKAILTRNSSYYQHLQFFSPSIFVLTGHFKTMPLQKKLHKQDGLNKYDHYLQLTYQFCCVFAVLLKYFLWKCSQILARIDIKTSLVTAVKLEECLGHIPVIYC